MKSYVKDLAGVLDAVLADCEYAYPAMRCDLDKDRTRLHYLLDRRGLPLIVGDLPTIGKHLDRSLDVGAYQTSGLPATSRYRPSVPIPKMFRGLYLRVFNENGSLKEDCDVQAIFFLRQLLYVGKKTALRCDDEAVDKEVRSFIVLNESLPKPDRLWRCSYVEDADIANLYAGFSKSPIYASRARFFCDDEDLEKANRQTREMFSFLRTLDAVSNILSTTLGPYEVQEWGFKHGPGVVSNLAKGDYKYSFPQNSWPERLDSVFPYSLCAKHVESAGFGSSIDVSEYFSAEPREEVEPYSELMAVPKTISKPRLIAAEPHFHMWCQQNIKHYVYSRVARTWIGSFIRFTDQTLNQELCARGSKDGSLQTVDLSAASDSVSCHAVGQLFRANPALLRALMASRTRILHQEISGTQREFLDLHMYSTMGNATTFPVESLLFLSVALSVALTHRGLRPTMSNIRSLEGSVSVFGDDIICPTECRELLYRALECLHFQVNTSKSYAGSNFRESCGADTFQGVDVTPIYWKAPYDGTPEGYSQTVDVSNNFYKKFLVNASCYVASTINGFTPPITRWSSGVVGLRSLVDPGLRFFYKRRWNSGLQRVEYLVTVPTGAEKRTKIHDESALLQWFTEEPPKDLPWESGVRQRLPAKFSRKWVPEMDILGS